MLIKQKLIANTVISIVSMFGMLLLLNYSSSSLKKDISLAQNVSNMESAVLHLQKYEKSFIYQKKLSDADNFNAENTELQTLLANIKNKLFAYNISTEEVNLLTAALASYKEEFSKLVEAQKRIGLSPQDGFTNALTKAVKQVERSIGKNDFELLSLTLQLRSHEKDFLTNFNIKHLQKFNRVYKKLESKVAESSLGFTKKAAVNYSLPKYKKAFMDLVKEQEVLGFDAKSGLRKSLEDSASTVIEHQSLLVLKINRAIENFIASLNNMTYLLFSIALIITFISASMISRSIINSVSYIKKAIIKVSESNNLTLSVQTKNKDELTDIANAFNEMINNFHQLIISTKNSAMNVNQITATLTSNIHDSNKGIQSQMANTDMVATAVTEMVATIEEIAKNTEDAANNAAQANESAENGMDGVVATVAQINILSDKLIESENVVTNLSEDSQMIGNVLDVIRSIADQTNLLALNAAIEAARAGEHGRGFAVVADEVRTLASRTQTSTKEIEVIIHSLQTQTQKIVKLMGECKQEGKESTNQANQAGMMLEKINEEISGIMDMNTAISTAIQEQSVVASEVNKHIVSIRDLAVHSGDTSQKNNAMSTKLESQANQLIAEVDKFTV